MQKPPVHAMPQAERPRPRMGTTKRIVIGVALASGIHGAVLTSNIWVPAARRGLEKIEQKYTEYSIRKEREELIENAKAARREGTFRLGEFILAANRIDAKEKGESFNEFEARAKYAETYQLRFRVQTEGLGNSVRKAMPEALKGVQFLLGAKTMAGLLLEGGGNCHAVAHTAVSLLYDAGLGENTYIRVYKRHMVPTYIEGGIEYDLTSGKRAKGGIRIRADALVESYEQGGDGFAYPESNEKYPGGEIPLFARNALEPPIEKDGDAGAAASHEEEVKEAYTELEPFPSEMGQALGTLWLLDPLPAQRGTGAVEFRPQKDKKTEEWLEAFCREIVYTEKKFENSKNEGERLVLLSKLGIAYSRVHWEAALLGKPAVSRSAEDKRQETIKRAKELIGKINWKDKERRVKIMEEISMNITLFAFLGNAGEKVLDMYMEDHSGSEAYPIAALIAKPSSRGRGFGWYRKLEPMDRMKVVDILSSHEVRPTIDWEFTSLGPVWEEITNAYYDKYGCEGEHPTFEGLERIIRDADAENRVGKIWSERALAYLIMDSLTGRYTCLSFGVRPEQFKATSPDGYGFLKEVRTWVEGKKDDGLDTLRKRVDYLLEKQMSVEEVKRLEANSE